MGDLLAIQIGHNELFPINSGAIRFKLRGFYSPICLVDKEEPHDSVYEITFNSPTYTLRCCKSGATVHYSSNNPLRRYPFQEFWLTWYSSKLCMGSIEDGPFLEFVPPDKENHNRIGFIKFCKPGIQHIGDVFDLEVSPHSVMPMQTKLIENGKLLWVKMVDNVLPPDALIGGFENEPTYIARVYHNGSLCPGRYIPSKQVALIPWGFSAHEIRQNIEILCGFDAMWLKTSSNNIPENAFVGGTSEVRNEPLYIGRAMHDGHLITGKVHVLYKGCYLPYRGQEIMVSAYELLVLPYITLRGRLG